MRAPLLLLLALFFVSLAPQSLAQEETMLHILDYEYQPDPLEVAPGTQVVIMNFGPSNQSAPRDDLVHTVTAVDGSFDVSGIPPDFSPHPFTAPSTPGEYLYYCRYHGDAQGNGMVGVLVVTEGAAATPTAATPTPAEKAESPGVGSIALIGGVGALALAKRRR